MTEIKIICACGQKFKFDVEPLNGLMPCAVNCPACGADATAAANAVLTKTVLPEVAAALRPPVRVVRGSMTVFVIRSPQFGILNLKGDAAAELIAEDTAALLPVLGEACQSTAAVPKCHVLFVYCDLDRNGRIRNSKDGLREIIRDSGALIVVVASKNDGEAYVAFGGESRNKNYGKANLVMTVDRSGPYFPKFFARLFAEMNDGVTMPLAYVKLAPLYPDPKLPEPEVPATIFACEAGQLTFK